MSEIDSILNPSMLGVIFTFVIGLFASSTKWLSAKSKLKSVGNLVREIENSIEIRPGEVKPVITPEESKRILAAIRGVVQ